MCISICVSVYLYILLKKSATVKSEYFVSVYQGTISICICDCICICDFIYILYLCMCIFIYFSKMCYSEKLLLCQCVSGDY